MKRTARALAWTLVFLTWGADALYSAPPKKLKIKSVHFEGNRAFAERRLHRVMLSRPSTLFNPSYYYPEVFQDDLKSLELFYQQNGYLEARILAQQVQVDTTRRKVDIQVQVSEGELTRVEGVGVFGNPSFSDEVLLPKINIQPGGPLRRKRIEEGTLALLTLYADNGYLDAEVKPEVRVDTETHRALIDFLIQESVQCRVGEIRLAGLQKVRPYVVRRELRLRSGEVVSYSRLLESQRRLYLTGLFRSVFIRPQPSADGDATRRDILIEMKEGMSGEFNVTVGYETIEKLRVGMEIYSTNLRGRAHKLGLAAKVSFTKRSVEAFFTEPWTWRTPWRTDITISAEYLEEPGFDLDRLGGQVMFGRSFLRRSHIGLTYRQEKVKLSHIRVHPLPDQLRTNIRSLELSLVYDTRDNLFNATQGVYFEWTNELAGLFLSGTNSFTRSIGRFKAFYSWNPSTVFGTALEAGWIGAPGGLQEIPLHERFYAGGPNSLRGFDYQKVGPLDESRVPIGGQLKLVWNLLEIRRSLYKMIGGVLFADLGNVWLESEQFNLWDMRPAAGFGVRVNTPVGLARLDYGINLRRRAGEPGSKWYFNMGHVF